LANEVLRILLIPGYEAVDELSIFLEKLLNKLYKIKIFVIGEKCVVEQIGKRLGRKFLSHGNVVLYKINYRLDNIFDEALRLFININPSIIIYFLRKDYKNGFDARLFYPLALNKGVYVCSYIGCGSSYIGVGEIVYNVDDLISLIEGYSRA